MKFKHLCITFLFVFFITVPTKLFSLGAGVQIGFNPITISDSKFSENTFEGNITGTLHLSRLPFVVGAGFNSGIQNSDYIFGISGFADWWILDVQLVNIWNLYSGIGVTGNLNFNTNFDLFPGAGARVFIGTSLIFLDNFIELNLQANAQPSVVFIKSEPSFQLKFPVEAGIRWHF